MGSLEGVVSTRAAWIGPREVVEVRYRPAALTFEALLERAVALSCDQRVYATTDAQLAAARARVGERAERFAGEVRVAKEGDQLYYLGRSPLGYLPLTPAQARQVNAALGARVLGAAVAGTDAAPEDFLSPRQVTLARRVAGALTRDAEALSGLDRPRALALLDEYSDRLEAKLTKVGADD